MVFIVDSGATKADWMAISESGEEQFFTQTLGLNPEVITRDIVNKRLSNNEELEKHRNGVTKVFFYGAGCGTKSMQTYMEDTLSDYFTNAQVHIKEDTYAAVFATINKKEPAIVNIIGTGSNCSLWNGEKVIQKVHSLGYTIMDDCSGNYFGKRLIRGYYFNKMSKELSLKFEETFNLEPNIIKTQIYKESNPNKYLATFAKFIIENREDDFCKNEITKGFKLFYENYISQYPQHKEIPSHFVGSIAYYLAEDLKKAMNSYGVSVGKIIRKPIDGLLRHHQTYTF